MPAGRFEVIVRRRKQIGHSDKIIEILQMVIDHDVRPNDILGSAKDDLLPGDKRKVFLQPFVFLDDAIRILHRRADNIDVINLVETVENVLAVFDNGAWRKKPFVRTSSLARSKASISGIPLTSSADFLLPVCFSSRARYCSNTSARTPSISTAIVFMHVCAAKLNCEVAHVPSLY